MDIQKYTGIYATSGDVREAVSAGTLHNPYIAIVQDGNYIDWNGNSSPTPPVPPEPVYSAMPLTFEIISGGTIYWILSGVTGENSRTISYSKDSGNTWTDITSTLSPGASFDVEAGDVVMFKGNNFTYYDTGDWSCFRGSTAVFIVYGNIMSLIDATNFSTLNRLVNGQRFLRLFYTCTGLTSAENLILPATALSNYCYQELFYGCTSLTTAPELPARTLAESSYMDLFYGCTNLNYIKCLATNKTADYCTLLWVKNVAATGTFVKHPNMTGWTTGNSGIPTGWTVIDADI